MPNWCSTSLVVRGPEEEVTNFYESVLRIPNESHPHLGPDLRIFEAHIPTPQELRDTTATSAWKEIPDNWKKMLADGEWTQEDYDKRVAENNELLKKQEDNLVKYGARDWYDWQIQNWGVKWGDCDTDFYGSPAPCGYNNLWITNGYFQTPWGTATLAWTRISKKCPNCIFILDSDEEAGFFQGIEMVQDGEVVFEDYYEPCEYPEEVDWEDDDSVQSYEDWKEKHMDDIAGKATTYLRNRGWLAQPIIPDKPKDAVKTSKPHVWK